MAPPGRPRFYSPREVSAHCTPGDLWLSYLGRVYDLSPLCARHRGDVLLKPIIEAAGKDISHWFNPKTKDIRTHIDPMTGCLKYYTPQGRFLHIPPSLPRTDWDNDFGRPWWKDSSYEVGILSSKTRFIRIINTLTSQEQLLEVCAEETIWEILQRYLPYNAHAASYTWKYDGANLDMDKTLDENGVHDEDEEFEELGLDADEYMQSHGTKISTVKVQGNDISHKLQISKVRKKDEGLYECRVTDANYGDLQEYKAQAFLKVNANLHSRRMQAFEASPMWLQDMKPRRNISAAVPSSIHTSANQRLRSTSSPEAEAKIPKQSSQSAKRKSPVKPMERTTKLTLTSNHHSAPNVL